ACPPRRDRPRNARKSSCGGPGLKLKADWVGFYEAQYRVDVATLHNVRVSNYVPDFVALQILHWDFVAQRLNDNCRQDSFAGLMMSKIYGPSRESRIRATGNIDAAFVKTCTNSQFD